MQLVNFLWIGLLTIPQAFALDACAGQHFGYKAVDPADPHAYYLCLGLVGKIRNTCAEGFRFNVQAQNCAQVQLSNSGSGPNNEFNINQNITLDRPIIFNIFGYLFNRPPNFPTTTPPSIGTTTKTLPGENESTTITQLFPKSTTHGINTTPDGLDTSTRSSTPGSLQSTATVTQPSETSTEISSSSSEASSSSAESSTEGSRSSSEDSSSIETTEPSETSTKSSTEISEAASTETSKSSTDSSSSSSEGSTSEITEPSESSTESSRSSSEDSSSAVPEPSESSTESYSSSSEAPSSSEVTEPSDSSTESASSSSEAPSSSAVTDQTESSTENSVESSSPSSQASSSSEVTDPSESSTESSSSSSQEPSESSTESSSSSSEGSSSEKTEPSESSTESSSSSSEALSSSEVTDPSESSTESSSSSSQEPSESSTESSSSSSEGSSSEKTEPSESSTESSSSSSEALSSLAVTDPSESSTESSSSSSQEPSEISTESSSSSSEGSSSEITEPSESSTESSSSSSEDSSSAVTEPLESSTESFSSSSEAPSSSEVTEPSDSSTESSSSSSEASSSSAVTDQTESSTESSVESSSPSSQASSSSEVTDPSESSTEGSSSSSQEPSESSTESSSSSSEVSSSEITEPSESSTESSSSSSEATSSSEVTEPSESSTESSVESSSSSSQASSSSEVTDPSESSTESSSSSSQEPLESSTESSSSSSEGSSAEKTEPSESSTESSNSSSEASSSSAVTDSSESSTESSSFSSQEPTESSTESSSSSSEVSSSEITEPTESSTESSSSSSEASSSAVMDQTESLTKSSTESSSSSSEALSSSAVTQPSDSTESSSSSSEEPSEFSTEISSSSSDGSSSSDITEPSESSTESSSSSSDPSSSAVTDPLESSTESSSSSSEASSSSAITDQAESSTDSSTSSSSSAGPEAAVSPIGVFAALQLLPIGLNAGKPSEGLKKTLWTPTAHGATFSTDGTKESSYCALLPNGAYIRDPKSCSKFYVCANGGSISRKCPGNLYFDIEKNICNFPSLVDCSKQQQLFSNAVGISSENLLTSDGRKPSLDAPSTPEASENISSDNNSILLDKPLSVSAVTKITLGNPTEERTKLSSAEDNSSSSENYLASPKVTVSTGIGLQGSKQFAPAIEDLKQLEHMSLKQGIREMNPELVATEVEERSVCSSLPNGAYLRDSKSCSKFYICANGQAISRSCPKNLYFDVKKKVCNFPQLVECLSSDDQSNNYRNPLPKPNKNLDGVRIVKTTSTGSTLRSPPKPKPSSESTIVVPKVSKKSEEEGSPIASSSQNSFVSSSKVIKSQSASADQGNRSTKKTQIPAAQKQQQGRPFVAGHIKSQDAEIPSLKNVVSSSKAIKSPSASADQSNTSSKKTQIPAAQKQQQGKPIEVGHIKSQDAEISSLKNVVSSSKVIKSQSASADQGNRSTKKTQIPAAQKQQQGKPIEVGHIKSQDAEISSIKNVVSSSKVIKSQSASADQGNRSTKKTQIPAAQKQQQGKPIVAGHIKAQGAEIISSTKTEIYKKPARVLNTGKRIKPREPMLVPSGVESSDCSFLPNGAFIRDSKLCGKFYVCANGRAVPKNCPGILYFDIKKRVCNFPSLVDCRNNNDAHTAAPVKPSTTSVLPPSTPIPDCSSLQNGVYLRHPNSCSKFYVCANGRAIARECPKGLYIDTEIKYCDFPSRVACSLDAPQIPNRAQGLANIAATTLGEPDCRDKVDGTTLRDAKQCNKYYICVKGTPATHFCAPGKWFDLNRRVCDPKRLVECSN
ncbi:uncharacterized protein Dvir_GJ11255, isoform A [Drosophila virilis]|uniref:Uncharacterized protein, isoform A n=1 Tax=Drosophila virilis TaxID=7244 RepID=B4LCS3_DROVI|nr:uncharacterized protein Dvir_GJ11255, isoform A [Drosophila virilis]